MYLDSAYLAKFYVNEPDALAVRKAMAPATYICSSSWALIEVTSVFHRHAREGALTVPQGRDLADLFRTHVDAAGCRGSAAPNGNSDPRTLCGSSLARG